ncbi:MAG: transcription termination/antitermination protein NusA [Clostridium sp. CAG:354_28_25]|nr:MAG: transcription termination/antitermination protein NusA [Clostridium sp. CAG:354_28_25]
MREEGIDNKQLIVAIQELEKEKGIKKDYLLDSIESALLTAYKRNYNSQENVKVVVDRETGASHLYSVKEVVEHAENPILQISLEEARKLDKEAQIGGTVDVELVPKNFGRIAAQTAKQVIIQKLREAEREIIYSEYSERKGEIVSGIIQKADQNIVVMDLGKVEGVMPAKEQIPTEKYHVNDKIKGYILDVEKGAKGVPQVVISRACPEFVKKLFEFEIPEIYEGLIEIKAVSRDAGSRSKVAVYSPNENIDPVGSCVGQKGVRIQNIINELNGEKIDVIEWNADLSIYISSALLPAQVMAVDIDEENRVAQVIVPDDQLSLAIGKSGQNARLAAKLTGLSDWRIDIKSETQFRNILMEKQAEMEKADEDNDVE